MSAPARLNDLTRRLDRIAGALDCAARTLDADARPETAHVHAVVALVLIEARAALGDVSDLADLIHDD